MSYIKNYREVSFHVRKRGRREKEKEENRELEASQCKGQERGREVKFPPDCPGEADAHLTARSDTLK